jgi:asparagine synthase (glutamine-hydrolysing)
MCGIAGVFFRDRGRAAATEDLGRMTAVLRHRGPDAEGVYVDGPVGLGHRRLSIIDLAGGGQPMHSGDGTSTIVFNGEIYNFRELYAELRGAGHRFASKSDTEVILHAYEEAGERCVERLRGMFAFAIWDPRARRLFLARDRVGIKPLYYYWDGDTFLFASEVKAILQHPAVTRRLDPFALDDYLTYLYVPAPRTIFRDISKLRPGHTLTVSAAGIADREYWDLSFAPRTAPGHPDAAPRLLETLREAVRAHLVSDVPLGAFLSGGVDSSAVVALMAGLMDTPVRTASVGFRDASYDELPFARLVARRFGTQAHERCVEAAAAARLDALVWHFDEPFADSSMVPTSAVSQAAREAVTVCLSGDGGDENFAGYRRYRFDVLEHRLRRMLPGALGPALCGVFGRVYPKADWLPRPFRAKTLLTNLALPPERAYFHSMSWFTPEMKAQLYTDGLQAALRGYDPFTVMAPHFQRARDWDPLSRVQYVDIKTYLVDDILTKVDRASMAHSLEVRVPLLDHQVMEHAAGIPAADKLRGGEGKHILKRALAGLVPDAVLHRPKMGFSIPLAGWLRSSLKEAFEDSVLARDAFIAPLCDPAAIRRWWGQHQRGTRDYACHLWALLVLERWGRRFMTGGA